MRRSDFTPTHSALPTSDIVSALHGRIERERDFTFGGFVGLIVLHIILALLIRQSSTLAILSLGSVMAFGTYVALTTKRFERVAYVIAYIVGAEVLWRMTEGALFWEIGKYGTAFLAGIALIRMERVKVPGLLLLYFILLLPSAVLTGWDADFSETRNNLSFYLSGPLAILALGWFFASLKLDVTKLSKILTFFILPVVGIGSLSLFGILTTTDIQFTTESNFQTSGGFGPNQVGALLGLGALAGFLLTLLEKEGLGKKPVFLFLLFGLFLLSLITFSRSGVLMFAITMGVVVFLLSRLRGRAAGAYGFVFLIVLSFAIVYPVVDEFTGGSLTDRYSEETTTGRTELIQEDIYFWTDNPIFGVGVGKLKEARQSGERAAHTEFSRLLGEHGLFGVVALIALGISLLRNLFKGDRDVGRIIVAACICWGLLFMAGNALRLVAPAFMLGLSFVQFSNGNLPDRKTLLEMLRRRLHSSRVSESV